MIVLGGGVFGRCLSHEAVALTNSISVLLKKKREPGNSLVAQWLGLGVFTAVDGVQSLVGELRWRKPLGVGKKNEKRKKKEIRKKKREREKSICYPFHHVAM